MKFNSLITLCLLTFSNLCGLIVDVPHFKDLTQYINKGCLVILDIDDTLLIPAQTLGNDCWFRYILQKHKSEGDSPAAALEKAIAKWEGIRQLTKMNLVEEGTDNIVSDLQKQGYIVMGLTTQGLALATRTIQQLQENNIDLSITAPSQEDHYFMNGGLGNLYRHGILFTSGTAKGESLLKLLNKVGLRPSSIVFINDKEMHLRDIARSVEAKGIEYIGLRYSYSDERINNYDPRISDIQWHHSSFERILSDEEAQILLNNRK